MTTTRQSIGTIAATAVLALALASEATSEVTLPNIFGDRMVLQCEKPVRIWGFAEPGEKVTVRFGDQTKAATTDADGNWSVQLESMPPSFEGRELVATGKSGNVTLSDVLVGEVWLCGGQSNMEWTLRSTRDADVEIASADYPAMRYIRLPHVARPEPQRDFPVESPEHAEGNWRNCTSATVENCTGVGYYFARRLHRRLKVPVGLIDTSWGGTMAQHWVSKETMRPFAEMKPYFDTFETAMKAWNDGGREEGAKQRYEADLKTWQQQADKPRAEGEREPRRPNRDAYTSPATKRQPAGMYNGMIVPLDRMTIRGVLFYQGENNSFGVSWKPFPETFPAVIADWRKAFGDELLPFGIIQIAGWSNRRSMTYDMNHHTNIVREVQFNTWRRTENTGLIVTFDTNSNGSIHPARKLPVGGRSARWALAEVYGVKQSGSDKPLEWRGPVYQSMEIRDGKVIVTFEEGTSRGLRLDEDDERGFYIAGGDQEFHHARVRVDGGTNSVVVWHDDVPEPVAVRYGWSNLPTGGLMNGRELPAYPFRTDRWPLVPHQSTGAYEVGGNAE
ncbi:MAG: sialate O-acetylesterase [Candidatus Nealsonbacteria bacterium]|nr:sialate O-acetylesterase [Candidatus Nealsonbacteria bacterium]